MSPEADVEWVGPDIIREIFNREQFYQQTLDGRMKAVIKKDRQPDSPPPGEPVCTRSQIVLYYDQDNRWVALVHQYLRRDGTLGGSGKPDPKRLQYANRILAVRSQSHK